MEPPPTKPSPTTISPATAWRAEADAGEIFRRLSERFPHQAVFGECLQEHSEREVVLARWLHQQGINRDQAAADGPFANFPGVALEGSVDRALAKLAECEERLLDQYRGFPHAADAAKDGLAGEEFLASQRRTIKAIAIRIRNSLLIR